MNILENLNTHFSLLPILGGTACQKIDLKIFLKYLASLRENKLKVFRLIHEEKRGHANFTPDIGMHVPESTRPRHIRSSIIWERPTESEGKVGQ